MEAGFDFGNASIDRRGSGEPMASTAIKDGRKVFVSNISREVTEACLLRLLEEVGAVSRIQLKSNFAFVEFDTEWATAECVRRFNRYELLGRRLVIEHYRYRGGDPRYRPSLLQGGSRSERFRMSQYSGYRLTVLGLDRNTSWQDLKDFGRKGGNSVTFADVFNKRGEKEGVIEYTDHGDFVFALKHLDGQRLNGVRVTVVDPNGSSEMGDKYGSRAPPQPLPRRPPVHFGGAQSGGRFPPPPPPRLPLRGAADNGPTVGGRQPVHYGGGGRQPPDRFQPHFDRRAADLAAVATAPPRTRGRRGGRMVQRRRANKVRSHSRSRSRRRRRERSHSRKSSHSATRSERSSASRSAQSSGSAASSRSLTGSLSGSGSEDSGRSVSVHSGSRKPHGKERRKDRSKGKHRKSTRTTATRKSSRGGRQKERERRHGRDRERHRERRSRRKRSVASSRSKRKSSRGTKPKASRSSGTSKRSRKSTSGRKRVGSGAPAAGRKSSRKKATRRRSPSPSPSASPSRSASRSASHSRSASKSARSAEHSHSPSGTPSQSHSPSGSRSVCNSCSSVSGSRSVSRTVSGSRSVSPSGSLLSH